MDNLIQSIEKEDIITQEDIEELEELLQEEEDFIFADYRFIHDDSINDILKEELLANKYMLGCFSDWFIADITGLDYHVVKESQANESYYLLGEIMADHIDEVVSGYVSNDGYGHYFASYDGCDIWLEDWHIFRIE